MQALAANNLYVRFPVSPDKFLAKPSSISSFVVGRFYDNQLHLHTEFTVLKPGQYHGMAGWFRMRLAPKTWISTDPRDEMLHWKQCVFPALEPVQLNAGDKIDIEIIVQAAEERMQFDWKTRFLRGTGDEQFAAHSQSTEHFNELA
jgi:hypothetical protein